MNPTDEELIRIVKMIGLHCQLMDIVLLATVNGINEQNRMLAEKLPKLTAAERQIFVDAISKNETDLEKLEASSRQFHAVFESWSNGR